MLIDTHCHLVSRQFDLEEKKDIVSRALSSGVEKMITLGASEPDWTGNLDWVREFPKEVHACLGIHPNDVHETKEGWDERLFHLAQDSKLAAIGEAGLDYYHPAPDGIAEPVFRAMQHTVLERQFDLASQLGLNIVLHTRDRSGSASFEDAMAIAKPYAGKVRPVFHCFIGDKIQAARIIDELDGLLSITGIVTFKQAGFIPEVVEWCPADRIMLETDAPYLSPVPFRGKRNEPSYLVHTAACVASIRGESREFLEEQMEKAARKFFSL